MGLYDEKRQLEDQQSVAKRFFDQERETLEYIGELDSWAIISSNGGNSITLSPSIKTMDDIFNIKQMGNCYRECLIEKRAKGSSMYDLKMVEEEAPEIASVYTSQHDGYRVEIAMYRNHTIEFSLGASEYAGLLLSVNPNNIEKPFRYEGNDGKQHFSSSRVQITDIKESDTSIFDILKREIENIPEIAQYSDLIINAFREIISLDKEREEKPLSKDELSDIYKSKKMDELEKTTREQASKIASQTAQITKLETEIVAQEAENAKLKEESTELTGKNTELTEKNTSLENLLKKAEKVIDMVKKNKVVMMLLGKDFKKEISDQKTLPSGPEL